MKTYAKVLIAIFVFNVSSLYAQELKVDSLSLKSIDKIIKEGKTRISRTDTINKTSRLTMITGFDVNNRIVIIETKNVLSNLLKVTLNQIQLFDTFGNLILDIQSADGIAVSQHLFIYNEQSRLTLETLLVDGVEMKNIEYQYSDDGKLTKKREYLKGVILKSKTEK